MTQTVKNNRREKIRLLVADDHMVMRMGLVYAASAQPDMQVIAEVESGEEAIEAYRIHHPDVVILDLRMRGLGGLATIRALEEGVATIEDIDKGMQLGTGYPMGPFVLGDFVGLDTLDKIGGIMFDEYKEKRYASPPLLKRMVSLGYFGRKSGKGFYDYSKK